MFSKLLEISGLGLIALGLAQAISTPAGLIFGGAAIVLIGSATDDQAVGMALRRRTAWIRYAWYREIARENGVAVPPLRERKVALIPCDCGADEFCPVCGGSGFVPDPNVRMSKRSPHPPIRVDPQTQEHWARAARAREERAKLHDRTPALSRPDYNGSDDIERLA